MLSNYNLTTKHLNNFMKMHVGVDQLFNKLVEDMSGSRSNFPPYDIIKNSEDTYKIVFALAGFPRENIQLEVDNDKMVVSSDATFDDSETENAIYNGIARRNFSLSFDLSEYIVVKSAKFIDGLLTVNLQREVPESDKPTIISIE